MDICLCHRREADESFQGSHPYVIPTGRKKSFITIITGVVLFLRWAILGLFSLFSSFQCYNRWKIWYLKLCRWWGLNHGSRVSKATALPTEPQPLPNSGIVLNFAVSSHSTQKRPFVWHIILLTDFFVTFFPRLHRGIPASVASVVAATFRCIGSIFSGFFVLKFGPRPILLVSSVSAAIFAAGVPVMALFPVLLGDKILPILITVR